MLALWNPFLPVERVKSDSRLSPKSYFDRLFEDTWSAAIHDLSLMPASLGIESQKKEDGSLNVAIDVPGMKESDLTIEIDDNILTVKGQRKTATSSYSVHKSFTIPEGYETENVKAELKDGVLTLNLVGKPLPPPKEVKKIPIVTGQ